MKKKDEGRRNRTNFEEERRREEDEEERRKEEDEEERRRDEEERRKTKKDEGMKKKDEGRECLGNNPTFMTQERVNEASKNRAEPQFTSQQGVNIIKPALFMAGPSQPSISTRDASAILNGIVIIQTP
ncbi:hypothetical protein LguiA_013248 [Lonicera macranthoides]